jgi:nucleoside-diphosphate-sugar epimerase
MGGLILLTGATGFLGSQIARLLLRDTDHRLAVLVRGQDEEEARRRLERVWSDWPETQGAVAGGRVRVLPGDLSRPGLGLDPLTYAELTRTLTHIVHAAAELKLDGELEELRRINVEGTARLLELARTAHADHGLERYAHVSTAYVAGGRTGEVAEEELTDRYGFSNAYEQTKYEGELKVREAMRELPVSVFRPGMVVLPLVSLLLPEAHPPIGRVHERTAPAAAAAQAVRVHAAQGLARLLPPPQEASRGNQPYRLRVGTGLHNGGRWQGHPHRRSHGISKLRTIRSLESPLARPVPRGRV